MSFGLTTNGFKIKRLNDILAEIRQRFKDEFGDQIDLADETPEGQIIALFADREAQIWELAQTIYNSQYPATAEGRQLDNVVSITGTTRQGAEFSIAEKGVARGENGTLIPDGTIVSVTGNSSARFVTQGDSTIDIADGATFKSGYIKLVAEEAGPTSAPAGTLTEIETPVSGLESFTNEEDAIIGSEIEDDATLKQRRNQELQIAGSATLEAIFSELSARPLVQAAIVFENNKFVEDSEGRPPKSLDIVVLGDEEQDLADAIFKVVGGGINTIGDISNEVVDSQGFSHTVKFSRPVEVPIYVELDLTVDPSYPSDGDDQVKNAIVEYGENQGVGQDVIVYGYRSLINVFNDIPGIIDISLKIGKTDAPADDSNVDVLPRELAEFDTSRITINKV